MYDIRSLSWLKMMPSLVCGVNPCGRAVLQETLTRRRAALRVLLGKVQEPLLVYSAGVVGAGCAFFAEALAQGHEGVMAKRNDSVYRPGRRSPAWRKIKPAERLPCVVIGYRAHRDGSVARGFYAGLLGLRTSCTTWAFSL
jgi:ATP-dependent DNA ligase